MEELRPDDVEYAKLLPVQTGDSCVLRERLGGRMSPGRDRNTCKKDSNEKAKVVPTKLNPGHRSRVAFLFDLDGTPIDSVFQHVLAWSEALERAGIPLSVWRIHRRIGMSGGCSSMLCCENPDSKLLQKRLPAFNKSTPKPIFGSLRGSVPSPEPENSSPVSPSHTCRGLSPPAGSCGHEGPGSIREAGPGPLPHRGKRSERAYRNFDCCGRQLWDLLAARRAHALGVGLLSGGYGQDEMERAGAYRVYQDPSNLLRHVDEVGVRKADFSSFKSLVQNGPSFPSPHNG